MVKQQKSYNLDDFITNIFIFFVFLFIFIYTITTLCQCTNIILDPQFSITKYNISLNHIFTIYLLNIIATFISLLVLVFIGFKFINPSSYNIFLNRYIGFMFALYVLIISSYTASIFNTISDINKQPIYGMAIFIAIASGFTLLVYISLFIHHNTKNISFHNKQQQSSNQIQLKPTTKQQHSTTKQQPTTKQHSTTKQQ